MKRIWAAAAVLLLVLCGCGNKAYNNNGGDTAYVDSSSFGGEENFAEENFAEDTADSAEGAASEAAKVKSGKSNSSDSVSAGSDNTTGSVESGKKTVGHTSSSGVESGRTASSRVSSSKTSASAASSQTAASSKSSSSAAASSVSSSSSVTSGTHMSSKASSSATSSKKTVSSKTSSSATSSKKTVSSKTSSSATSSKKTVSSKTSSSATSSKKTVSSKTSSSATSSKKTVSSKTSSTATSSKNAVSSQTGSNTVTSYKPESSSIESEEPIELEPPIMYDPEPPELEPNENYGVDDSWFDDCVFVGDSITVGFSIYNDYKSVFPNAKWVCASGLSYQKALLDFDDPNSYHPIYNGEKVLAEDAAAVTGANKAIVALGIADVVTNYGPDGSMDFVRTFIGRMREKSPDVKIYISSVNPMIPDKERANLNNELIRQFNDNLRAYAAEEGMGYLNVYDVLANEDGALPYEYCSDPEKHGFHLKWAAYELWTDYLKNNIGEAYPE